MYKILFCQHVKDHPLRCKYTMFFCNHQIFYDFLPSYTYCTSISMLSSITSEILLIDSANIFI